MDDDRRGGGGGGALEWWNIRDCSPSDRDEFIRREEGDRKKNHRRIFASNFSTRREEKEKETRYFWKLPIWISSLLFWRSAWLIWTI